MREIKFRAILLEEKITKYFRLANLINPIFSMRKYIIPWLEAGNVPDQYTERKASGIEVYAGDILKATLPERAYGDPDSWKSDLEEKDVIGEVKIRRSGGVGFIVKKIISNETKGISIGSFLRIKPDDEVIGNIYENPELLPRGDNE